MKLENLKEEAYEDIFGAIGKNKIVHDVVIDRETGHCMTYCGIEIKNSRLEENDIWPQWFKEMSIEEFEEFDRNDGIVEFDHFCKRCERVEEKLY